MDEKKQQKQTKKEKEPSVSRLRVIKRGVSNMKDDVDPIYKGTKMGFYALHGIPTWAREYKDGRLMNDSHGWATISGLFVGGTTGLGYTLATQTLVAATGPVGYAVLGVPLVCQGASYVKEAFRRAKKTELSDVIKARLQKRITEGPSEEYDLSCQDMVNSYITNNSSSGRHDVEENEPTVMGGYQALSKVTDEIYKDLFADNKVGKKYELRSDLTVRRKKDKESHWYPKSRHGAEKIFQDLILEKVSEKEGSANIELLGQVTAIYDQNTEGNMFYAVKSNKLWKK